MARVVILRVLALAIIIVGLNYVYTYTFYNKDLAEKCEQIITLKENQAKTDIFYFGESSNFNTRPDDSIQNSISDITNFFFPSLKITAINKPATHAGIYKHWIKQINLSRPPKAIIVTLNMRSFDATWIHSHLETPLQEGVVLIKPYPPIINRFLLSLNAFDKKTEQQRDHAMLKEWETKEIKFPFPFKYKTVREWDHAMAQGTYLKPDGSWDDEKITLACHYVKTYAFNIDESNPRIKDFDFICNWCNKNKIPLYLNLLAENIEYADSLVGKELVFLMRQNRDYLFRRYNKYNCKVVDNLELVNGLEFTDQSWTTEHYGYRGRMIIAKNLANSLKTQFSKYYKTAY